MSFIPKPYRLRAPKLGLPFAMQGRRGSFSHSATAAIFHEAASEENLLHCDTFEAPFEAVVSGRASYAVIPVQNVIAGDVPYVHKLIREQKLHSIGEYFLPIQMCLITTKGAKLTHIKKIYSHIHALNQCKGYQSRHLQYEFIVHADTAGAVEMISKLQDPTVAAIAPQFSTFFYDDVEAPEGVRGIQDAENNITRFLVLAKTPVKYPRKAIPERHYVTAAFMKPRRSEEWPLYEIAKALKDHGIRHTHPIAYQGDNFTIDEYYIELSGHMHDPKLMALFNTLKNPNNNVSRICTELRIMGCFPAHHFTRFGRASRETREQTIRNAMIV